LTETISQRPQKLSQMAMEGLPERTLLLAVLENAILEAHGILADGPGMAPGARRQTIAQAAGWLRYWTDDDKEPFTFPWICTQLGTDPYHVRRIANNYIAGKCGRPRRSQSDNRAFLEELISPDFSEYQINPPKRRGRA
jgi:hypothetical protein